VEELEPVWVCCGWRTPPTVHSNRFQLLLQVLKYQTLSSPSAYPIAANKEINYLVFFSS
jgi:hypothetical protein